MKQELKKASALPWLSQLWPDQNISMLLLRKYDLENGAKLGSPSLGSLSKIYIEMEYLVWINLMLLTSPLAFLTFELKILLILNEGKKVV